MAVCCARSDESAYALGKLWLPRSHVGAQCDVGVDPALFIDELRKLKPFRVKVHTSEKTHDEKCLMVGICNARKYGTGVPLNITGNPMDGKFEIVLVKKMDINSVIKAGLSKFDEKFHDSQSSKIIEVESAQIEFDQPRLLQLDGEMIDSFKVLDTRIMKGAVQLITNNDNQCLNHD